MHQLDRVNKILNKGLAFVAGFSLIAMMLVTVGEMVLRMFGKPMAGIVETIGWLAAITIAFALGYTQIHQGHVSISLFTDRLKPRLRNVVNMITYLTSFVLFVIVTLKNAMLECVPEAAIMPPPDSTAVLPLMVTFVMVAVPPGSPQ